MTSHFPHREKGAVLIVALLFLVMLTLLGVTAMTSSTMEERMAGNARDTSVAFQAAEAALRDARRDLGEYPPAPFTGRRNLPAGWALNAANFGVFGAAASCNPAPAAQGLCWPDAYAGDVAHLPPLPPAHSMTAAPSVQYGQFTGSAALAGVAAQPRYIIEVFGLVRTDESFGASPTPYFNFFRITAVGYGASPNTRVMLQEVIAKEPI